MLGEMLVSTSQHLLVRAQAIVDVGADPDTTLRALIGAHAEFASTNPDLITVQSRDLLHALDDDHRVVRRLQRRYVEIWVDNLVRRHDEVDIRDVRAAVHATFGLLNSTPYTGTTASRSATLLTRLAYQALAL